MTQKAIGKDMIAKAVVQFIALCMICTGVGLVFGLWVGVAAFLVVLGLILFL
jgi:hypothetical protein